MKAERLGQIFLRGSVTLMFVCTPFVASGQQTQECTTAPYKNCHKACNSTLNGKTVKCGSSGLCGTGGNTKNVGSHDEITCVWPIKVQGAASQAIPVRTSAGGDVANRPTKKETPSRVKAKGKATPK